MDGSWLTFGTGKPAHGHKSKTPRGGRAPNSREAVANLKIKNAVQFDRLLGVSTFCEFTCL
jgi:hypothetical protein